MVQDFEHLLKYCVHELVSFYRAEYLEQIDFILNEDIAYKITAESQASNWLQMEHVLHNDLSNGDYIRTVKALITFGYDILCLLKSL